MSRRTSNEIITLPATAIALAHENIFLANVVVANYANGQFVLFYIIMVTVIAFSFNLYLNTHLN